MAKIQREIPGGVGASRTPYAPNLKPLPTPDKPNPLGTALSGIGAALAAGHGSPQLLGMVMSQMQAQKEQAFQVQMANVELENRVAERDAELAAVREQDLFKLELDKELNNTAVLNHGRKLEIEQQIGREDADYQLNVLGPKQSKARIDELKLIGQMEAGFKRAAAAEEQARELTTVYAQTEYVSLDGLVSNVVEALDGAAKQMRDIGIGPQVAKRNPDTGRVERSRGKPAVDPSTIFPMEIEVGPPIDGKANTVTVYSLEEIYDQAVEAVDAFYEDPNMRQLFPHGRRALLKRLKTRYEASSDMYVGYERKFYKNQEITHQEAIEKAKKQRAAAAKGRTPGQRGPGGPASPSRAR